METEEKKLMPLGPMALIARVPSKWLRSEAEAGNIPCLIAGKNILFDKHAVLRILIVRAGGEYELPAIEDIDRRIDEIRVEETKLMELRRVVRKTNKVKHILNASKAHNPPATP